jgi:hypothetical protein
MSIIRNKYYTNKLIASTMENDLGTGVESIEF